MRTSLYHRAAGTLLLLLCLAQEGWAELHVGSGPTFSYSYSPRTRLALDTNASNIGVSFGHEPTVMNCSYVAVAPGSHSTGMVTYVLRPDPGHVIEHVTLFQKGALFNNGEVLGEFSLDGGATFKRFFSTPAYAGAEFGYEDAAVLRNLVTTNLTIRYTIHWQTGFNYNVQFLRDCDDAQFTLLFAGSILPQAEANRRRIIVRSGSTWKYLDDGSNQGTAWRMVAFNDGSWPSGPAEFGYGDGDESTTNQFGSNASNKYITTYYRRAFTVANPSSFDAFTLGLVRDDGAAVYLNGVEIFRSNLPAGTILFSTMATNAETGLNENFFREINVAAARLRPGTNVLAVEIHQSRPDSSDISFDLDFSGRIKRPRLGIIRDGNCANLSWEEPDFVLETAEDVRGPWVRFQPNPGSPVTVCDPVRQLFYRLSFP